MGNEQIEIFFAETTKAFHFLETQYGYQQRERDIEHPDEGRDARARVIYIGSRVGVQIGWGFADAIIGVYFFELLQAGVFPSIITYYPFKDDAHKAKGIRLYTLAEMLGHIDDPDFLLKKVDNFRTRIKRSKIIQAQLPDILAGLARATQTYATSILQGDTTIFPRVMNAYAEKMEKVDNTQLFKYNVDDHV